jgi:hypothetical protein
MSADQLADIFSQVGDQLLEDCIFELSDEQVLVQYALVQAYVQKGASGTIARKLAAQQIQPPKLSAKCEQVRRSPDAQPPMQEALAPSAQDAEPTPEAQPAPEAIPAPVPAPREKDWATQTQPAPQAPKKPVIAAIPKPKPDQPSQPAQPAPIISLAGKKGLPKWDCADGVDYVTIHLNGYERKLTGGEICSPFQDVVSEVPAAVPTFRLGYTITTGRLFVISNDARVNGKTIVWGLSGRDVCRNNPDPDCFAAKAVGPLPPGEYSFASDKAYRVSFGPRTKRHVAGIYLKTLWSKERFTPQHIAAIKARGNIAIHMRLKGEMSEACIGLEPKGWAYVASLIKEGRATGLNAFIDEPYPQVAEAPPIVVASGFSLTSLFK